MSEIINNRQDRVNIMKSLIRQLHSGVSEDKVKTQLEHVLDEADYSDVFLMEVQLVQEGIPAEAIQKLCDTHTRVLKKHLDLQETPQTIPGHPVHTFIQENIALSKNASQIRELFRKLEHMPATTDVTEKIHTVTQLINNLMDVDKHYRRKEYLLFPYFEKNNLPGPPMVMWGKHDEVRDALKNCTAGFLDIKELSAGESLTYYQLAILPTIEAIEEMIYKEEKIMFPTALNLLTEQDWYEIYLQTNEYGYCLYEPEFEWTPEGGVTNPLGNVTSKSGRIQMPTGSLSLEELIGTFQTLPFDLTFVDSENTVRYFSPGKNRVFDRSRAILGRKVQYCHPPKSVHIVKQIVQDFKTGKQDRARFWIKVGGKLIYICYFAVRDENNHYLGTLEVTQDLSEVQEITGERRLLTYDGFSNN
jgi:DUF438 domain-containing protein